LPPSEVEDFIRERTEGDPVKPRILVVEDEEAVRRLIRATLSDEGYEIEESSTGESGMEQLRSRDVDLLVLDLQLPKMNGWQVLEAMRREGLRDQVRVMILTAQSQESDILRGWQMGVDHYCMKPFEPDELLAAVDHVLTSSRERLARAREDELKKTQLLHLVESVFE
jgi:two-component system alkaline phosphatase synthesis response regulator PhoP